MDFDRPVSCICSSSCIRGYLLRTDTSRTRHKVWYASFHLFYFHTLAFRFQNGNVTMITLSFPCFVNSFLSCLWLIDNLSYTSDIKFTLYPTFSTLQRSLSTSTTLNLQGTSPTSFWFSLGPISTLVGQDTGLRFLFLSGLTSHPGPIPTPTVFEKNLRL